MHAALQQPRDAGAISTAVLFLHSFAFPEHESMAREMTQEMGYPLVSLSHQVAPEIKAVGRGDTPTAGSTGPSPATTAGRNLHTRGETFLQGHAERYVASVELIRLETPDGGG